MSGALRYGLDMGTRVRYALLILVTLAAAAVAGYGAGASLGGLSASAEAGFPSGPFLVDAAASASYDQSARTLTVSWMTPARGLCTFDVLAADRLSARGLAGEGRAVEVTWRPNTVCAQSPWTVPATFTNDFYVQVGFHCLKKPGQCAGVPGYDNGWSNPVKVTLKKTAPIDCATAKRARRSRSSSPTSARSAASHGRAVDW